MADTTVEIDGLDYSADLLDVIINDTTIYMVGSSDIELIDVDDTISAAIERYQEIKIYSDGIVRFCGVVIEIEDSDNSDGILKIISNDYFFYALRTPVFKDYTDKTASYIIDDIIGDELGWLGLGTTEIDATVNTYTYEFRGKAAMTIFQELALKEDFVIHVDENKDVIFRSNSATDTDVTIDDDNGDIIEESFRREGGDIVNIVYVRGAGGKPPAVAPVGAIYEDEELIVKYGRLPLLEITEPELTTEDLCYDRAVFEVRRRNEDPSKGILLVDLDFTLKKGQLVTINLPSRNFSYQLFLIQSARHDIIMDETELNVIYYTRQIADLVQLILEGAKKAEQYLSDKAISFAKYKSVKTTATLTATITVEKQTVTGAVYGGFAYGGVKVYGAASGSYESTGNDEVVGIATAQGIEDIWRLISQIATVPTILDQSNTYIAISPSTSVIGINTLTLMAELYREQCDGAYPTQPATGKVSWRIIITDGDLSQGNINSIALFNHVSAGNLEMGFNLVSEVVKSTDENVRITISMLMEGLEDAALNRFIDIIDGTDTTNYMDGTKAFVEVVDSVDTYNEACGDTTTPKFTGAALDEVLFEMEIDTSESAAHNGHTFTQVDLYSQDPDVTGILVKSGTVVQSTLTTAQKHRLQHKVKLENA